MSLAVEVFHCLPDELMARLEATDGSGMRAARELLAYYRAKQQERAEQEWAEAMNEAEARKQRAGRATY